MVLASCSSEQNSETAEANSLNEPTVEKTELNEDKNEDRNEVEGEYENEDEENTEDSDEAEEIPLPFSTDPLTYEADNANFEYESASEEILSSSFPEEYTFAEGVLTFRGNHLRDSPSYGFAEVSEEKIELSWEFQTGTSADWGGGAGWTGQPLLVNWEEEIQQQMNIHESQNTEDLIEVIQGSLDGHVYFLDLKSGEQTRDPIEVGNTLKGTPSLDSRGIPLLYVGDGVRDHYKDPFGFRLFSLYDGEMLHFQDGEDDFAYREWAAFDSSALFNREDDTLLTAGENGLLYNIKLNTEHDPEEAALSIDPEVKTSRYEVDGNDFQGIENSIAAYKNMIYFADNGGSITAYDLEKNQPAWILPPLDDTDSTIVLEIEDEVPYLYTGAEVDNVGEDGTSHLRKIHGLTGEVIWQQGYDAYYYDGVVGGVLATPVLGKDDVDDTVFFTIARTSSVYAGTMVALDKDTGEEKWKWDMPDYAWSSAVPVYQKDGPSYLVQGDWQGNLHLLDAKSGDIKDTLSLGANIEASPAVYDNMLVVATRANTVFGIEIK